MKLPLDRLLLVAHEAGARVYWTPRFGRTGRWFAILRSGQWTRMHGSAEALADHLEGL